MSKVKNIPTKGAWNAPEVREPAKRVRVSCEYIQVPKQPEKVTMKYALPGMGTTESSYCNKVTGAIFCDCGHLEPIFHHCFRWDCPEDYFYTAQRAAGRIEERLFGCFQAFKTMKAKLGRVNHVTFSMPKETSEEDFDFATAWTEAKDHALEVGFLGGLMTFHPYRVHKNLQGKILSALRARPDLRGGIWRGVHEDILNLGSMAEYCYWSPHYHMIGFFPKTKELSNDFKARTGWIYKNIDPGRKRNVFTTARYILTHQAIVEGRQSYTYFGICSPNKLGKKQQPKELEYLYCECGQKLHRTSCFENLYKKYESGELKPTAERSATFFKKVTTYFVRHARQTTLDSPPP